MRLGLRVGLSSRPRAQKRTRRLVPPANTEERPLLHWRDEPASPLLVTLCRECTPGTEDVAFSSLFAIVFAMAKLTESEISESLTAVPAWQLENGNIVRTFEFKDFTEAMKFVNVVADKSEAAWHHPDIDIRWNKVRLALCTHSEGGLTSKDFSLAQEFDSLA